MAQAKALGDMGSNRTLVEPGEAQYYAAMARIERYEAAIFEMIRLMEHAKHTSDVERAKGVGEKALEGTRYDRARHIRS